MAVEKRTKNRKSNNRKKKLNLNLKIEPKAQPNESLNSSHNVNSKLCAAVSLLQGADGPAQLRSNAHAWIKWITQIVSLPETSTQDAGLAVSLVTHLVSRTGNSSSAGGAAWDSELGALKFQLSPQLLQPLARALVSKIGPKEQLNVPCLLLFSKLLALHPGTGITIRTQLEQQLLPWLSVQPESAGGGEGGRQLASLAADVWAVLPVATPAGAASSELSGSSSSRVAGVATARGQQMKQLLLTLDLQLDGLLRNIVGAQSSSSLGVSCSGVDPISFSKKKQKNNKNKSTKSSSNGADTQSTNQVESEDSDTNNMEEEEEEEPVAATELSWRRCCNLLLFVERLLESVARGSNSNVALVPRDVLLPIFRILQVSSGALSRYRSAEVQRLGQLWPALQHRALHTLRAAMRSLHTNLALCYHLTLQQLTDTLQAVPANLFTGPPPPATSCTDDLTNGQQHKGRKEGQQGHRIKSGLARAGQQQYQLQPVTWAASVAVQQETVRLVYLCIADLTKLSRGLHGLPLPVAKAVLDDLAVRHTAEATLLQTQPRKSLASMSIKKKSKRRGYTVLPPTSTPTAVPTDPTKQPLTAAGPPTASQLACSQELLLAALDVLAAALRSGTHLVLTAQVMRLLQSQLMAVAKQCLVQFGRSDRAATARWCPSVSGRADVRSLVTQPAVLVKLIRLVTRLCTTFHPQAPPPLTEALYLLELSEHLHQNTDQVFVACEAGVSELRYLLSNPRVAAYVQAVEDHRAGAGVQYEADEEEEASEDEASAHSDSDEEDIDADPVEEELPQPEEEEEEEEGEEQEENGGDENEKDDEDAEIQVDDDAEEDVEETAREECSEEEEEEEEEEDIPESAVKAVAKKAGQKRLLDEQQQPAQTNGKKHKTEQHDQEQGSGEEELGLQEMLAELHDEDSS